MSSLCIPKIRRAHLQPKTSMRFSCKRGFLVICWVTQQLYCPYKPRTNRCCLQESPCQILSKSWWPGVISEACVLGRRASWKWVSSSKVSQSPAAVLWQSGCWAKSALGARERWGGSGKGERGGSRGARITTAGGNPTHTGCVCSRCEDTFFLIVWVTPQAVVWPADDFFIWSYGMQNKRGGEKKAVEEIQIKWSSMTSSAVL